MPLFALALAVLLPCRASAEGGVRILECTVARVCDAAGSCEQGSGRVTFRMEPVDTQADGSGRYALEYADLEAEMEAASAAGPFFWMLDRERHTLIASSETEFLWHGLTLEPAPAASIRFLTCTVRQ